MEEAADLFLDRPISTLEDDRLGHGRLAKEIVRSVQPLQAEGIVVGIEGPWGSGKSSLLNLVGKAAEELPNPPIVIRFNPWWFSGREDLYRRFFKQFAADLRIKSAAETRTLNAVADGLDKLGSMSAAIASVVPEPSSKVGMAGIATALKLGGLLKRPEPSLEKTRSDIRQVLKSKKQPIWVFIDDMDRLEAAEMLQMFALVRSLADFPWVSYFVAFDLTQVTGQISREGYSSPQHYLEKILDLNLNIPYPAPLALAAIFAEGLIEVFGPVEESQEQELVKLYLEHKTLLPTVRRIKRLIHMLRVTKLLHRDEVHRDDLIKLEILRLAAPYIYREVPAHQDLIIKTTAQTQVAEDSKKQAQQLLEGWLKDTKEPEKRHLSHLLQGLFPLLHGDITQPLIAYSERQISDPITFALYFQLGEREIPTAKIIALLKDCESSPEPLKKLLQEQARSTLPVLKTPSYLREISNQVAARDQADTLDPNLALNLVEATVSEADRWMEGLGDSLGFGPVGIESPRAVVSRQRMTLVTNCMGGFEFIRERDRAKFRPFMERLEASDSPIWSYSYLSAVVDQMARRKSLDPDQQDQLAIMLDQASKALERLEEPAYRALLQRLETGQRWPEPGYFLPLLKAWNLRGDSRYQSFFLALSAKNSLPLVHHLAAMAKERTLVNLQDLKPILNQEVINQWISRIESEGTPVTKDIKDAFEKFFKTFS